MKLKDYKQLEKNAIYRFDNLYVQYDGEDLFTKYAIEQFWYPMHESDKWFIKWADRKLTKVGETNVR